MWVLVHAKPWNTTAVTDAFWKDEGSGSALFAPLTIEVTWEESGGTATKTSSVTVRDNGTYDNSGNTGNRIRPHRDVVEDIDGDFLCDSYHGHWGPVYAAGSSTCIEEFEYGFDCIGTIPTRAPRTSRSISSNGTNPR